MAISPITTRLAARPVALSLPAATGTAMTGNITDLKRNATWPESSDAKRAKLSGRPAPQCEENECLNALWANFHHFWGKNVAPKLDHQTRVEQLLSPFTPEQIGKLTRKQLLAVLEHHGEAMRDTAVADALASAKKHDPDLTWFKNYVTSHPLPQPREKTRWVMTMQKAPGCPQLEVPLMRRALKSIHVHLASRILRILEKEANTVVPEATEKEVMRLLETIDDATCLVKRLVMLMKLPAYQKLGLKGEHLRKALKKIPGISEYTLQNALQVFRAKTTQEQEIWFNSWYAANQPLLSHETSACTLAVFLFNGKRQKINLSQFALLLWRKEVSLGFSKLDEALKTVRKCDQAQLTEQKSREIEHALNKYPSAGGWSSERRMGMAIIECGITAGQLMRYLIIRKVEFGPVSLSRAALTARQPLPTEPALRWIYSAWQKFSTSNRLLNILTDKACPAEIKVMRTAQLQRTLWHISADYNFTRMGLIIAQARKLRTATPEAPRQPAQSVWADATTFTSSAEPHDWEHLVND